MTYRSRYTVFPTQYQRRTVRVSLLRHALSTTRRRVQHRASTLQHKDLPVLPHSSNGWNRNDGARALPVQPGAQRSQRSVRVRLLAPVTPRLSLSSRCARSTCRSRPFPAASSIESGDQHRRCDDRRAVFDGTPWVVDAVGEAPPPSWAADPLGCRGDLLPDCGPVVGDPRRLPW